MQNNTKKNKDISVDMLEKLVKASGPQIVIGYVRRKKVKPCKDYEDARKKAFFRFSKVNGGRPLENGFYAAVIGFRWLLLFIFLFMFFILTGLVWWLSSRDAGATEFEAVTTNEIIEPSVTAEDITEPYEELYITIPGYVSMNISKENPKITLFNPVENAACLKYELYIDDYMVADTGLIGPGDFCEVDFYDRLKDGIYEMSCIAAGYSFGGKEKYNSALQKIELCVN